MGIGENRLGFIRPVGIHVQIKHAVAECDAVDVRRPAVRGASVLRVARIVHALNVFEVANLPEGQILK
jgi:hypothetical protein